MSDEKIKTVPISEVNDFSNCNFKGKVISKRELGDTKTGKKWFSFVMDDGSCDIKVSVFNNAE